MINFNKKLVSGAISFTIFFVFVSTGAKPQSSKKIDSIQIRQKYISSLVKKLSRYSLSKQTKSYLLNKYPNTMAQPTPNVLLTQVLRQHD